MTSESETQAAILRHLAGRPDVLVWRNNVGAARNSAGRVVRFGLPGSADIEGVRALYPDSAPPGIRVGETFTRLPLGQFFAVEVKSATGRQSQAQRAFQAAVERVGGLYILARSVDDVKAWFP